MPLPPPPTPAGKSVHGMDKQLLLVANAHMHWDPEYSDVKLVQTMMFLSEVKNIVDKASRSFKLSSGENNAIPLVLCADLNSLPDSGELTSPKGCFNCNLELECPGCSFCGLEYVCYCGCNHRKLSSFCSANKTANTSPDFVSKSLFVPWQISAYT